MLPTADNSLLNLLTDADRTSLAVVRSNALYGEALAAFEVAQAAYEAAKSELDARLAELESSRLTLEGVYERAQSGGLALDAFKNIVEQRCAMLTGSGLLGTAMAIAPVVQEPTKKRGRPPKVRAAASSETAPVTEERSAMATQAGAGAEALAESAETEVITVVDPVTPASEIAKDAVENAEAVEPIVVQQQSTAKGSKRAEKQQPAPAAGDPLSGIRESVSLF
jgi:hypothetical protein